MNLILASSSPRRQSLLNQVHIPFTIRKPDVDESEILTLDPSEKVKQLAKLKGQAVTLLNNNEVILSADTVVSYQDNIFEKPKNENEARQMLSSLSDSSHDVYTGVMIRSAQKDIIFVERTEVEFLPLSQSEIDWYISTNEPFDKAGGYGIQEIGAMFVKRINGDYFNVVGLPISKVCQELRGFSIYPKK